MKVAIVGAGNMGMAFAKSFIQYDLVKKENLFLIEKNTARAEALQSEKAGVVVDTISPKIGEYDLIILSVKPQDYPTVSEELKKVIQNQGDKFVVLHIMGSHPNPCNRLPSNWNSEGMNCYDNSVKYTDYVLGEIFQMLKNTDSVVLYVSDHGLKIQADKLLHTDSKESTQVPFFIWFSDKVPSVYRITGRETLQTQTTYVYPLIMKYMGLEPPKNYKSKENKYLNLEMKSMDYSKLPD